MDAHGTTCKVLIKWWGLPYDACTWESVDVHPDLPKLLERYRAWTKASAADIVNGGVNGAAEQGGNEGANGKANGSEEDSIATNNIVVDTDTDTASCAV